MPSVQSLSQVMQWVGLETAPAQAKPKQSPEVNPYQSTDRLNLSMRSAFGLSTIRLIEPMDELAGLKTQDLTPSQQNLQRSADFQNIYRNFDILPGSTQKGVLNKLELILKKYPDFMTRLQQVDNPQYGAGFQFFFIPPHESPRWQPIPAGVRGTTAATDYSGIVFSSPVQSVLKQDGLIRKGMQVLTMGVMEGVNRLRKEPTALDVGGMFNDSSPDTFAHEMGHVLHSYFLSSAEQLEIWAIYSMAQESNSGFISDYSRTNHMEFLAEGVEAYLQQDYQGNFSEREHLKTTNPRLYDFVERMLEPGVARTGAQDPLLSAWIVARTKGADAASALKNLGLSGQKQACKCSQPGHH
ncbi:hypothetical protein COW36_09865 [bacterium (Candidatus Blackallbacteria) CG17_big_fil_post_rev_8_21_14_2_50_48_46]|uniref:Uncharacterized protein n=1 Tax=bacterium (Candidatus Blackallbacteria) CG17_big_fil_post_rev_8_21_14_2_50_48_46 TaxID=2014261 RepID=A0A2M7G5P1_9BACT|nr:MAG: hypothetical protein COW64_25995 [bacterium (Candidatus Blackallbacteria) CG18_big_fil_WC_8_21_14_2_50_49_26]PIW17153.1 MAG: hypothetical protein COW36_09865 [bacterium (Candidatus Blackallbacteria) CG17_big_fil_post_rev_8_21_14_2_50_48_46]PIW49995.1 MAG: hypothetical protein COW20_04005 [bacterium (Candidatus Blackallbacteria) CG13_big_fil_rev_8_21_14_2_50_49_14]